MYLYNVVAEVTSLSAGDDSRYSEDPEDLACQDVGPTPTCEPSSRKTGARGGLSGASDCCYAIDDSQDVFFYHDTYHQMGYDVVSKTDDDHDNAELQALGIEADGVFVADQS